MPQNAAFDQAGITMKLQGGPGLATEQGQCS